MRHARPIGRPVGVPNVAENYYRLLASTPNATLACGQNSALPHIGSVTCPAPIFYSLPSLFCPNVVGFLLGGRASRLGGPSLSLARAGPPRKKTDAGVNRLFGRRRWRYPPLPRRSFGLPPDSPRSSWDYPATSELCGCRRLPLRVWCVCVRFGCVPLVGYCVWDSDEERERKTDFGAGSVLILTFALAIDTPLTQKKRADQV